ncbi:MAG: hypothetical protein COB53_09555 [Elusimicrobia bacterium]|nr:MAG: hypothetical protein COB53_09555 [Elusimicrobiota bacterium]
MENIYRLLRPEVNKNRRLVSAEIERLALSEDRVARYEPDLRKVIETLVDCEGWTSVSKVGDNLLGARKFGCTMSFEPGGQWEVSAPPTSTVSQWRKGQEKLDTELMALDAVKDLHTMHIGLNPWEAVDDIPLLPSPRYDLMDAHFKKVGGRGREMMRLTVGLQVNLDYNTEKHAMQLLRAGFFLAPPLSALFSNSPFARGKSTGNLSERHFIWTKTDPDRSGFIEEALRENFTLREYAAHIASVPLMYAFDEAGDVYGPQGHPWKNLDSSDQERNALGPSSRCSLRPGSNRVPWRSAFLIRFRRRCLAAQQP